MVLQVRLYPSLVKEYANTRPYTLATYSDRVSELQTHMDGGRIHIKPENSVVAYGPIQRFTVCDPNKLSENKWWSKNCKSEKSEFFKL